MTPIKRLKVKSGKFGPASMRETIDIPIVEDNLVCVHCGKSLGLVSWTIVSSVHHKGLIAFACVEHVGHAMNITAAAFGGVQKYADVKVPDAKEN